MAWARLPLPAARANASACRATRSAGFARPKPTLVIGLLPEDSYRDPQNPPVGYAVVPTVDRLYLSRIRLAEHLAQDQHQSSGRGGNQAAGTCGVPLALIYAETLASG